jgi:hypothetical protein
MSLIQTSTQAPHPKSKIAIQRGFNPTRLFVDRNRLALFWFLIAAIAILIAVVQPLFLVERLKQRERIVVIDPAGTYYVSPLLEFSEAKQLHAAQGALAAQALLNASPLGVDDSNLLKNLFLPQALKKAKQFWESTQPEFESKQIHQKVEIAQINILETRDDYTLIEVKGQLVRNGLFQDQTFTESPAFRIAFKMLKNPNLLENGRFPTAVKDFKYEIL